jgi:hypothetical protein
MLREMSEFWDYVLQVHKFLPFHTFRFPRLPDFPMRRKEQTPRLMLLMTHYKENELREEKGERIK